jgi:hypothetical protein
MSWRALWKPVRGSCILRNPVDTFKLVGIIFSVVGVSLLAGGGYAGQSTYSFLGRVQSAPGRVVELMRSGSSRDGTTYSPVVEYEGPDSRTIRFTGSVASSPPSYTVGERVTVLYDPTMPEAAKIDSFLDKWFLPVLLGGMGLVFTAIGQALLWTRLLRSRRNEWLKRHGRRTPTRFQGVSRNNSVEVNGRSPYRILTQWLDPATNAVHAFQSEDIWFDPTEFVRRDTLDVLIDPANPKRYWMDTTFLPKSG